MIKLYSMARMLLVLALIGTQQLMAQPTDSLRPKITSFFPTSGATNTIVEIIGRNLFNASTVRFGGVHARQFVVVNDTTIWAKVGNGATGAVSVWGIFGGDSLQRFTYLGDTTGPGNPGDTTGPGPGDSSRPHIDFFYPDSARRGETVEIVGRYFTGTTSVSFGGVPATSFTVVVDSVIRAVVGNGASGFVRVTTVNGTDSARGFVYLGGAPPIDSFPPTIVDFNPKTGTRGSQIRITGAHFTSTTRVTFGMVPAFNFAIVNDSLIVAIVDTGASGGVEVFNPYGTDSMGTFYYRPPIDSSGRISVAPNPASGFVIVTHPSVNRTAQIKLTDVSGTVTRAATVAPNTTRTRLNLAGVRAGVYKVSWTDGSQWYTQTLLVQ